VWFTYRQACGLFLRGATLRVAGRVAAIVGSILSGVNQGSVILDDRASWATWVRVAINYLAGCRTHPAPDQ